MSTLILVRHANTFEPGEVAFWVGAKEDPPLSASGRAQLPELVKRLESRLSGVRPLFVSSPLRRARETAEALAGDTPISIDSRLTELDFGRWGGLTDAQIIAAGHQDDLREWRDVSTAPKGWGLDEVSKGAELSSLLNECKSRPLTLVVTSHGILKLIGRLLGGPGPWSVRTASFCVLRLSPRHEWQINGWNV